MHVHTVTRIVVAPAKLCRPRWNEGFGSHGNLRLSVFHNQKNSICVAHIVEKSIILVYRMGKLNRQGVKMWGHLRKLMMMCRSPTIPDVSFAHESTKFHQRRRIHIRTLTGWNADWQQKCQCEPMQTWVAWYMFISWDSYPQGRNVESSVTLRAIVVWNWDLGLHVETTGAQVDQDASARLYSFWLLSV
jgi:hypothetical protein